MAEPIALLELRDVTKVYGSPDGSVPAPVLKGVSFKVHSGESVSVAGPSGSGKTTLLNIIGGLDSPTSGSVLIAGCDIARRPDAYLSVIRNREIGFVFQLHHLLPQCTALENVLVPTLAAAARKGLDAPARARKLLDRVGLKSRMHYRPGMLSGGECQRVAVVRALINKPRLLLADEPTGSLDHASAVSLAKLLLELNVEEGTALVVVTHSAELAGGMDRRYQLADGELEEAEEV